jgi:hypothetical protein
MHFRFTSGGFMEKLRQKAAAFYPILQNAALLAPIHAM